MSACRSARAGSQSTATSKKHTAKARMPGGIMDANNERVRYRNDATAAQLSHYYCLLRTEQDIMCRYDRYDSWSLEPGAWSLPGLGDSVYLDMHMLGVGSHATFPSITIDTAPAERNTVFLTASRPLLVNCSCLLAATLLHTLLMPAADANSSPVSCNSNCNCNSIACTLARCVSSSAAPQQQRSCS
jgi:hypothetical protein